MNNPIQHSTFYIQHSTKKGFIPTPTLAPFRFFKILSRRIVMLFQELISVKNDGETKKPRQSRCGGFTLVELLVTIGIFILMTSVVLAKYRSFSTNSDFANAIEGTVLSLREAQVYGVGSKTAGVVTCGNPASTFNCVYGVYFSKLSGVNGAYAVFVDVDGDGLYNSASDTLVQIVDLWGPSGSAGIWISNITVNGVSSDTLSITFKRPNPDAIINGVPSNTSASITIQKGAGDSNSNIINITSSGQISIQ